MSTDADGNDTRKLSLGWDAWRLDREHWVGVEVQGVRFSGDGWSHDEQRAYVRGAGLFGPAPAGDDSWRWQGRVGSNGHTLLGGATLNTDGPRRREIFFERELLETEAGVKRGQVYNLVGAAIDHPFGERASGTALAGLQDFDDGNLRTHLRGNLVYAVLPAQGISLQLRGRYYRNSDPYLGGYYSPSGTAKRWACWRCGGWSAATPGARWPGSAANARRTKAGSARGCSSSATSRRAGAAARCGSMRAIPTRRW
ncbi:hypothetical protein H1235_10735 [Pseudoxanthomonas sp. NC8]|nr:hypothetical protein H1235_10735 [Pseudoxanthomonas sp. NC8]